jgi:hypothetical protein
MTILSDPQRAQLTKEIMEALSNRREGLPMLKADLRAAVNAADDWANANEAEYNAALPQPFRGIATPNQKSGLLEHTITFRRKAGV